ncbi:MBL fold metallo-hydrolase [Sphingomonas sp. PAMC 26617]|uniref:MBL fold metallo-hydrolase n=1 Tax=Sphingomonas sp. PAMC 26617 TaxID=1112216 RepID=UPI0002895804|nr:MBL fold metallo-hydrolase [Sphingomonas sp. PAMC 26617]
MRFITCAAAAAIAFASPPAVAQSRPGSTPAAATNTGVWTYKGTGTVNTYWIETPGGGLVVIDVQRDLVHAAQALAAVKALGKPVRAILITHAHPDHYAGIGQFKQAFPEAVVYASKATAKAIREDTYGWSAITQKEAPDITPKVFVAPDRSFDDNATLTIDGLTILTRELGAGEAHDTTAYYLPLSRDLYIGDVVLNGLHGPIAEGNSGPWLGILDKLEVSFPNARIVHPGHGASGPMQPMYDDERQYLRTSRAIAAEEIVRGGFTDAAKTATVSRINARFRYTNPTGQKDIVTNNVDGLFKELSQPPVRPVK